MNAEDTLKQARATTSPVAEHTYYVPMHKRVYGSKAEELKAFLYATYMRHAPLTQDGPRYACDGATMITYTDGRTVVRLCIDKKPFDVEERP